MKKNAVYFLKELEKFSPDRRIRLAQFILKRCVLVAVSSEDQDSAYRIFSILNDRGLDLSHTDILKAEIIGSLKKEHQNEYADKWEKKEEELGREAFQELFTHIRMIYRRTKLRETVLKEFREHVVSKVESTSLIDDVIMRYADTFSEIRGEKFESTTKADEINSLFGWLNRLDNFDWLPPAIEYLTKNRDCPKDVLDFVTDLERLAVGMFLMRTNVTKRIERYGNLLKAIDNGADLTVVDSPMQLSEKEKNLIRAALDGPIYSLARVPLFLLLRLDSELSSGAATYKYNTISIEHVLPQSPDDNSQWMKDFPDDNSRENWVHRIGNLVLLTRRKNSQARNYDFEEKKKRYFLTKTGISPFALTSQVIHEKVWTKDVLERRQKECVEKLVDVWRLT